MLVYIRLTRVVIFDFAKIWKKSTVAPFGIFDQSGPRVIVAGITADPSALEAYAELSNPLRPGDNEKSYRH